VYCVTLLCNTQIFFALISNAAFFVAQIPRKIIKYCLINDLQRDDNRNRKTHLQKGSFKGINRPISFRMNHVKMAAWREQKNEANSAKKLSKLRSGPIGLNRKSMI
jgi:hypothetical protein